ncbi:thiamine pyrophosphate-binding protein [Azospirillum sp. TSO22-1]|uniref:thiamine pyrophosphate-binding protein n=1 Tax=Azospirillum sp. TSO22-1 TaxID=716789 RepID=UPI000D610BFE|nr:thiamine pyrophosphate-binding protein [Azospirillum sp. TSO22-1]PWC38777.1 hypothetical protein TSO221_26280 [Azospirillum sp. TSO22-1]
MFHIAPTHSGTYSGTVAGLLLEFLRTEGVRTLFGIPGGALKTLLDVLNTPENNRRFTFVVCRQESGAAYMADGYHRISDRISVVLTTSGPGATNALTGAMNAEAGHSAVLTITGEVPEQFMGMGYLQEGFDSTLDVNAVYRNALTYSALVSNTGNFRTLFLQALRDAMAVPRRAAHIGLPDDVSAGTVTDVPLPASPAAYRCALAACREEDAARTLATLLDGELPLLLLGNGCRRALADPARLNRFTRFVERFALPVATTPNGKAIFPETHPLSLRNYGAAACLWPAQYMKLADPAYDRLVVLGSTLGQLATASWNPLLVPRGGQFVQVDADPSVIGRSLPVDHGVVAELGAFIDTLCALSETVEPPASVEGRRAAIDAIRRTPPWYAPEKYESEARPLFPQAMIRVVNTLFASLAHGNPRGNHIFIDCGSCVGWALHYLEVDTPNAVHSSLAMGPMGFAVGGVVGAQLACLEQGNADAVCLGIVGDGAFLMQGAEVSTAHQYGAGAIWLVLRDNDLSMVSQGQAYFYPPAARWYDHYKLGDADLAQVARGYGADAYDVHDPHQLAAALQQAVHNARRHRRPQVVVAHINTHEVSPYFPPKTP